MSYKFKIPQGWKEWGGYLLGIKFLIDFGKWLFNNRGSSKETQKEFANMKEDNDKRFNTIESLIEKTSEKQDSLRDDMREIFKEETSHFITKELSDERMKRHKEEILHAVDIKIVKAEAKYEKAVEVLKEATSEHRASKDRIKKVTEKLLDKIK